jgi:hypothetical protein
MYGTDILNFCTFCISEFVVMFLKSTNMYFTPATVLKSDTFMLSKISVAQRYS